MEKIKYDFLRYNMYSIPMAVIASGYSVFVSGKPAFYVLPFFAGLLIVLNIIIYIRENRASNSLYFTAEGLRFQGKNEEQFFKWSDVKVSVKELFLNDIDLMFVFPMQEKKIRINTFHAKSLADVTRKYSPKEHELYKIVKDYAKDRGLDF